MKKAIIASVITLPTGVAIGYFVAKSKITKEKDLEVAELKEYYDKKLKDKEKAKKWEEIKKSVSPKSREENSEEPKRYVGDKGDISKYHKVVAEDAYIPANAPLIHGSEAHLKEDDICVIRYDEVDEYSADGYLSETWTYYVDDVVTDEVDEVVEKYEQYIGDEFINYFGVYEGDAVYVLNRPLKTIYEIVKDAGPYNAISSIDESLQRLADMRPIGEEVKSK